MFRTIIVLFIVGLLCGCRQSSKIQITCPESAQSDNVYDCPVPEWSNRPYTLYTPALKKGQPVPVIFMFHGGGGNRNAALKTTCPEGNLDDEQCLHLMALEKGVAIVSPSGTSAKLFSKMRTWNTGGGQGDWRCTSGNACKMNVDEQAYMRALLKDLRTRLTLDPKRIYATGLSNGGAMSHRIACQMSDVFAAIAPIGGAMAWTTSDVCAPQSPVAILQIHGTKDPCWKYDGGIPDCPTGQKDKKHPSVSRTMTEWAKINGCAETPTSSKLPNMNQDEIFTERFDYAKCKAPVSLLKIHNGGHTWPNGHSYLGEKTIGKVTTDWGNPLILDWLLAQQKVP